LEPDHDRGQFIRLDHLSDHTPADIVILAKRTQEIAGTEKDGAGPVHSHQGRLLPEMRRVTGHYSLFSRSADPSFPRQTIYTAFTRAEPGHAGDIISSNDRLMRSCIFPLRYKEI
jgi:hypothetical protein